MVTALIFAGGVGSRMKSKNIPKQFLKVEGIPIIIRTIEHFEKHPKVNSIVVVCLKTWIKTLEEYLEQYSIQKVSSVIPGGSTGYQSIHNGIVKISDVAQDDDIVLICDGVRPILTEELISNCIKDAKKCGTAIPVTESIDSVLFSDDGQVCKKNFDRKKIFITQAPQGYQFKVIKDAHDRAERKGIESVSSADLMIELGKEIHLIKGLRENIKVTTEEDLLSIRATQYYQRFQAFAKEEILRYKE